MAQQVKSFKGPASTGKRLGLALIEAQLLVVSYPAAGADSVLDRAGGLTCVLLLTTACAAVFWFACIRRSLPHTVWGC